MIITRFRGDTYPEVFILRVDSVPIDLDALNIVQLAVRKPSGVFTINGIKDVDSSTGRVTFDFTNTDIISDVGIFRYDIQSVGSDTRIITFVKDRISFKDDVNKT